MPTRTWTDRKVLLTGGTGFIGQHLARRLLELGAKLTIALCPGETPAGLLDQADWCEADVRDQTAIRDLVQDAQPQVIFHLAAVGVTEPFIAEEKALAVNLYGTLHVLRAAQAAGVKRLVVTGSSYEYGPDSQLDPGNVYAASKVAAWAFCRMFYRAHGAPVVVARPFNVYGPGQSESALIPAAMRAALADQDFATTPGEQLRDFVFINDIVAGLLAAASAPGIKGQSLDLGTGVATSVRAVVERIFALTNSRGQPQIGALSYRPGVVWEMVADAERTYQLTGWRAGVGLDAGLQVTIEAMRGK